MKNYNITSLSENINLAAEIIREYVADRLSLAKIAIKHRMTIHVVRQILIDNNIELREGNKKK